MRGGKPHWILDFRYVDENGRKRRVRRDATVQSYAAACQEAKRLMGVAADSGVPIAPEAPKNPRIDGRKRPTLREFALGEFEALFMPHYRPATRERYRAILKQGLLDLLGARPLDAIGERDDRMFGAWLAQKKVQARGPRNFLRTLLRAAASAGYIEAMPKLAPPPRQSKKLPDAPSEGEVSAMLATSSGWLRLAIALSAYAGLRMGEVRALEVRDVDLERGFICVRHAMSAEEVMTPKSGHERLVPLAPQLVPILTEARRLKLPQARLVLNERGATPQRQAVLMRLVTHLRRHNLPPRSFHSLRHFFCSTLVRRGAGVEAVRLLAGHSDLATTQRYVHAVADDLRAAIAKLAESPAKSAMGN
jgi:integrase